MFNLIENAQFALDALKTNRFRTFLTLLGIIIGVAAVIMIGSAASSGRTIIFKELETFGLKSLWVYKSTKEDHPGKSFKHGSGIDNDDVEAVRRECSSITRMTPAMEMKNQWAKYGNKYAKSKVLAVDSSYDVINDDHITSGRFLWPDDIEFRRSVCVIGVSIADKLFGTADPIGKEIKIEDYKYTVIGILEEKDRDFLTSIASAGGQDANDRVIIPLSVYQRRHNTKEVNYIQAEAIEVHSAKNAAEHIKRILTQRYKDNYRYESQTMQQYIETAGNILRIVSWIGSVAAILSLVVGGIGIMNIMIASVVERTKEIGIKKALGARNGHIIAQFLIEAVLICLLGGIIGVILGAGSIIAMGFISNKPILLDVKYIVISLGIAIIVGVLSGLYPAMRAASMDPVEALRFE